MKNLWTPWRYKYIVASKTEGCLFCSACNDGDDLNSLVLYKGKYNIIMLNRYPYSNGHLMIAPIEHITTPENSSPEILSEMNALLVTCMKSLKEVYNPGGFNIGMNIGKTAGAGVEDHYHLHLVPRWEGDTNFMTVLSEVRLIPQDLRETFKQLKPIIRKNSIGE